MDTYDAVGFIVGSPGTGVGIPEGTWCGLPVSDKGTIVGRVLDGNDKESEGREEDSKEGEILRMEGEVDEVVAGEGERLGSKLFSDVSSEEGYSLAVGLEDVRVDRRKSSKLKDLGSDDT